MGAPKLTTLATAIKAAEKLSDEEKQTLRDVLRPESKPRQKAKGGSRSAQKRKAGKDATATDSDNPGKCQYRFGVATCDRGVDANIHQLATTPDYHEFVEPAGGAKGASA